jgi:AcrR family transcriptional regulator
MPRISNHRPPAVPQTDEQRERVERILAAASEHGKAKGLERMQMVDVARDAGVAIATLYRYFPSKTALFVGVMRKRMEDLGTRRISAPGTPPWEGVAQLLILSGHGLLQAPLLARAMLNSNTTMVIEERTGGEADVFGQIILREAGIDDPTPGQLRLVRIIEQAWFGVMSSALNGHITPQEMEEDTRLVCQLLLGGMADA